jgi:hypothetical protein
MTIPVAVAEEGWLTLHPVPAGTGGDAGDDGDLRP